MGRSRRSRTLDADAVERRFDELKALCELGDSLLEARTPLVPRSVLEKRSLVIAGRARPTLAPGPLSDPRDVTLWACRVGSRRDLGWMPDTCVDAASGLVVASGPAVLVAAAGDSGRALDAVPRGVATIVVFRFVLGIPPCIDELPVIDAVDVARVWLCSSWDRAHTDW